MVAWGYSDKVIAHRLGITYGTLRTHLQRCYLANNLHGRADLMRAWHRLPGGGRHRS